MTSDDYNAHELVNKSKRNFCRGIAFQIASARSLDRRIVRAECECLDK